MSHLKNNNWKEQCAKVLEDLKHRPSDDARAHARALLKQGEALQESSPGVERRMSELRKAVARYDRNTGRR